MDNLKSTNCYGNNFVTSFPFSNGMECMRLSYCIQLQIFKSQKLDFFQTNIVSQIFYSCVSNGIA